MIRHEDYLRAAREARYLRARQETDDARAAALARHVDPAAHAPLWPDVPTAPAHVDTQWLAWLEHLILTHHAADAAAEIGRAIQHAMEIYHATPPDDAEPPEGDVPF